MPENRKFFQLLATAEGSLKLYIEQHTLLCRRRFLTVGFCSYLLACCCALSVNSINFHIDLERAWDCRNLNGCIVISLKTRRWSSLNLASKKLVWTEDQVVGLPCMSVWHSWKLWKEERGSRRQVVRCHCEAEVLLAEVCYLVGKWVVSMGKNQQHKAMQASRSDAADGGVVDEEAGADVSFHTAEWHAARYACCPCTLSY